MSSDWSEDRLGVDKTFERVVRNLGVVALSTLLITAVGALYLFFADAKYTASATLFLTHDPDRAGNGDLIQIEIETHRNLIYADSMLSEALAASGVVTESDGDGFASRIIDEMRGRLSRDPLSIDTVSSSAGPGSAEFPVAIQAIRKDLAVEQIGRSRLLRISYTADEPQSAVEFLNSLVQVYTSASNYYSVDLDESGDRSTPGNSSANGSDGRPAVEPVEMASLASVTISPSIGVVLSIAALLGILVGIASAVIREFSRES